MYSKFLYHNTSLSSIRKLSSTIAHLTDVEGNLNYFENWANKSDVIRLKNGVLSFRMPSKKGTFIYGGDFSDKGPGDLRIGKALTEFKQFHPNNVFLIAGNREIKYRRFTYELDEKYIRQRLLLGQSVFWRKYNIPKDYVIQDMKRHNLFLATDVAIEQYINSLSLAQCQTLYLHWMLNETMGCGMTNNKPSKFEYRRQELAELPGQSPDSISDEAVTQSFIDAVAPDGIVTRYLKQAQLGVIQGETLFVHGAVTLDSLGYVPGLKTDDV